MRRLFLAISLLAFCVAVMPTASLASDHADPIINNKPDAGLTGLFVFPHRSAAAEAAAAAMPAEEEMTDDGAAASSEDGAEADGAEADGSAAAAAPEPAPYDELILILGVHPALIAPGPYDLDGLQYNIHIDHHSEVTFTDPQDLARYGGTVVHPKGISADASLSFQLNNDATLKDLKAEGLDASQLEVVTGLYDDPFIFPRFFGKNIIAIAVRVPLSALPAGRQDYLFWGTTTDVGGGDQVDHVGRSNRTQLARFDFLNTVPPNEHVDRIHAVAHKRTRVQNFLKRYPPPALWQAFQLLQAIRHYDYVPDVMVFSLRNEPGYPNGRRLPDDIVGISCAVGDCLLQETAFQESEAYPRITINDRPFASEFPFLGEAWPAEKPEPTPGCFFPTLIILIVLGLLAWIFFKIVCKICRRKKKS